MEASSSSPYFGYLVLLAVVVAALVYLIQQAQANASSERVIVTAEFASFQRNYCRAFLCALACEWLQNSHLFVLLRTRGLSTQRIAEIFAAGYVASWACGVLGAALALASHRVSPQGDPAGAGHTVEPPHHSGRQWLFREGQPVGPRGAGGSTWRRG